MPHAGRFVLTAWIVALVGMVGVQAQPDVAVPAGTMEVNGEIGQQCDPPPVITIAKGGHSGWRADDPHFSGADFVIRGPDAWAAFWHGHTGEPGRPPPINFRRRVVVVTIQGPQTTSGGPNIAIVDVRPGDVFTAIAVFDDPRPGPLDQPSNPFHIVAVRRDMLPGIRSVTFQHERPLPHSGVLVGRVFGDPPDGHPFPLPGAHVALIGGDGEDRHAPTGMDGSYFFVNVPPGEYGLLAEHPEFEPQDARIGVPPGQLVRHDFLLNPRPPQHAVIEGRVLGEVPDGEPVPLGNALVQLFHEGHEVAQRVTRENGVFHFEHVPPGEYVVVASHHGFFPQEWPVAVEGGDEVHHLFVLERRPGDEPGAFVGRVLGLHGDQRIPLAGALVRLLTGDGEFARTHTNDLGMFAMHDIPPGMYRAVAEKEGWLPEDADIEIHPGEPTHHLFLLHQP